MALIWLKSGIKFRDWRGLDLGYTQNIWHPDYDALAETNTIGEEVTKGLLHESAGLVQKPSGRKMLKLWQEQSYPIWQLSPDLLEVAGEEGHWDIGFAKNVISRALLRPRHGPVGQISRGGHGAEPVAPPTAGELNDTFTPSQSMRSDSGPESGQLNFGSYREGVLGAHDARNIALLRRDAAKLLGPNKEQAVRQLRKLRDGNVETTTTEAKNAKKSSDQVIAGVEHVKQLASNSVHGGINFFFGQTRSNPNIPTLIGPQQWMRWLLGGSPVTAQLTNLCFDYVHVQGKRVVVFCDTPWIQQMTLSILNMAGFYVNTIRSLDKGARKAKQIAEFVDPNSASQIFLANINIMSTGVNLQRCCHVGIAINFHHNAKTIRQMHHRLYCIGQSKEVVWHTLKVINSFYDHQERLCLTKWARQMSAEMSLPDWFPDNIREVVIFEF
ncbi:hypothetical protein PT974_04694 [Cladobotryum mycophilum]|uniref:Helicase C-terminal domain-containing protein n=1 Tax=Cladobotryum mycophilum TaxID=491253 RepID=A0ABR0SRA5_9HYPO